MSEIIGLPPTKDRQPVDEKTNKSEKIIAFLNQKQKVS